MLHKQHTHDEIYNYDKNILPFSDTIYIKTKNEQLVIKFKIRAITHKKEQQLNHAWQKHNIIKITMESIYLFDIC